MIIRIVRQVAAGALAVLSVAVLLFFALPAQAPVATEHWIVFLASPGTQSFTLPVQPNASPREKVFVGGILMAPQIDYSLNGRTVQFVPFQPIGAGAVVQIEYWAAP